MRRVCHSILAFVMTAEAAIMSVIAADLYARPAQAQVEDWPTRSLTLVVPFSAGGSSDTIGRIIADGISSNIRQPVVVENVAGAGGMLAGSRVAKATPDGYQFIIGNVGTFAQSQWLYKAPLYNALTDFAPVALLTDESYQLSRILTDRCPASSADRCDPARLGGELVPGRAGSLDDILIVAKYPV